MQPRRASESSISTCSHPLTSSRHPLGSPDPDGPTQAFAVWNRKFKVVAGSTRPLHTRRTSGRRFGRPGRLTTPGTPTDTRTDLVLPWPNNPSVHDSNPSVRTSADVASTPGARRIGYPIIASQFVRSARRQQSDAPVSLPDRQNHSQTE